VSNVDLINESFFETKNIDVFQKVVDAFIQSGIYKKEDILCLKLVSEENIKAYNKKYRGKNSETDVLSFPSEFKESNFIGDIIIDVNVANQQKDTRYLKDELIVLFVHGVLHLLGFDHLRTDDKKNMQDLENQILNTLKNEGVYC